MNNIFDIANTFLELGKGAPSPITNMKIQKLLYYSQGWHLSLTGEPLFDNDFERWTFGPVCPEIYKEFKKFKSYPITEKSDKGIELTEGLKYKFIKVIWGLYGHLDGIELSIKTHSEDPWLTTPKYAIIEKKVIKAFFDKEGKNLMEA